MYTFWRQGTGKGKGSQGVYYCNYACSNGWRRPRSDRGNCGVRNAEATAFLEGVLRLTRTEEAVNR